jgi:ABC-type Fe3+ transport system permease subunit
VNRYGTRDSPLGRMLGRDRYAMLHRVDLPRSSHGLTISVVFENLLVKRELKGHVAPIAPILQLLGVYILMHIPDGDSTHSKVLR